MEPEDLEPEERVEVDRCALCGRETSLDADRVYAFGVGSALCWECATARGGRYDGARERWEEAPDLSGLPDEAYGASPHETQRGRQK